MELPSNGVKSLIRIDSTADQSVAVHDVHSIIIFTDFFLKLCIIILC